MKLLIDGNSLLNPALLRGVDYDNGRRVRDDAGKEVQVNSAQYGVDNFFDKIEAALQHFGAAPRQCVVVWDGRNAKLRRRTFLEQYKVGRDKHPAVSEQLNIARERCSRMLLDLGAHVAHQDGMEADDVIGYLAKNLRYERNVVVTVDGDLSVLVDENTDVYRMLPSGGELNKNPYGPFPHKYITLYKALVGDTSDKIPGAPGFGDAKFVDLVRIFGLEGLEVMQELIENDQLHRLREDLAQMPSLQKIIDGKASVATSWRVASLLIDEVNTLRRPMTLQPGLVKQWDGLAPEDRVDGLKRFYGTKTLVHAGNYAAARQRFAAAVPYSPFVSMDIETSSTEESDEWVRRVSAYMDRDEKIDVLGHELTGMSLTFGDNLQHTVYMTVDHLETGAVKNITVDQCRELCELVPHKKLHTIIHNRAFEFSVLYRTWGEQWKSNGWAGMWPNAVDTIAAGSYQDENLPAGLKDRSERILGYKQQTYEEVTRFDVVVGELSGGRVVREYRAIVEPARWITQDGVVLTGQEEDFDPKAPGLTYIPPAYQDREVREFKMNELTASHVLDYGCDDAICTAALFNHYKLVMELERTWHVYLEVEQKPEYLTSLAFVQGIPISLEKLSGMERKDDERYDKAWATLRQFLLDQGWEGSVCPEFLELMPADVKLAVSIVVEGGGEFKSLKKKLTGLATDIRDQFPDNDDAAVLASAIEHNLTSEVNKLVRARFDGEPKINFDSPKQMQKLFFELLRLHPRILNKMTDKERANEAYRAAFKKWRQIKEGKQVEVTEADRKVWQSKATTDDTAVDMALALDKLDDTQRAVLEAYKIIKTVGTRRKLFYRTYRALPHWRDGRIHPALNQCRAVTRRYSASDPNVQQLPKRGEGVEFRQVVLPHKPGAVIVPPDFSGQELRLAAEQSGDENLTACYVGDNLRDVHSLTAVQAAPLMWGEDVTYERFQEMRALSKADPLQLKAKRLREDAKTTNFATQYDAQAETVSKSLLCEPEVAQKFIDAKEAAFPGIGIWKEAVREEVERCGYATTMMGARRHLRDALLSENKWEAAKAGRQGPNFKIQGSAAEMTKLAMCRVWDTGVFWDGRYDAQFYMPVHDELVFSVIGEHAVDAIREVHSAMTLPYAGMKIPVVSSISIGLNYGEQYELGDEFDAAAIAAKVKDLVGVGQREEALA